MFTMEMKVPQKPMIVSLGICTQCLKFWNHIASCMFTIFHKGHEWTHYKPQWHPNGGQHKLQYIHQWRLFDLDINEDNNSNANFNVDPKSNVDINQNNKFNANSNENPNSSTNINENPNT
jgi:hypothetical protein